MKRGHELDHGGLPSTHKTIKTSVAITKTKKYWSLRDGMGSRRVLEAVNHVVHHVYLCVNHVEGHKSWALIGQRCRHRKPGAFGGLEGPTEIKGTTRSRSEKFVRFITWIICV